MPYAQEDVEKQSGRRSRSPSAHSDSPLNKPPSPPDSMSSYPPMPQPVDLNPSMSGGRRRHVRMQDPENHPRHLPPGYDQERAQTMPLPGANPPFHHEGSRSGSWDLLAGIRKWEHSYEEFDSRNASATHLQFAQGDLPQNKVRKWLLCHPRAEARSMLMSYSLPQFVKFYNYLLNVSIITRWFLFIVPLMAIIWIPGILGLTTAPKATIWGVKLLWWSIWLSILWGGKL